MTEQVGFWRRFCVPMHCTNVLIGKRTVQYSIVYYTTVKYSTVQCDFLSLVFDLQLISIDVSKIDENRCKQTLASLPFFFWGGGGGAYR